MACDLCAAHTKLKLTHFSLLQPKGESPRQPLHRQPRQQFPQRLQPLRLLRLLNLRCSRRQHGWRPRPTVTEGTRCVTQQWQRRRKQRKAPPTVAEPRVQEQQSWARREVRQLHLVNLTHRNPAIILFVLVDSAIQSSNSNIHMHTHALGKTIRRPTLQSRMACHRHWGASASRHLADNLRR